MEVSESAVADPPRPSVSRTWRHVFERACPLCGAGFIGYIGVTSNPKHENVCAKQDRTNPSRRHFPQLVLCAAEAYLDFQQTQIHDS